MRFVAEISGAADGELLCCDGQDNIGGGFTMNSSFSQLDAIQLVYAAPLVTSHSFDRAV